VSIDQQQSMGKKVQILSEDSQREIERLKILKWTGTQMSFIWMFYAVQGLAAVCCGIGMLTDHWFEYQAQETLSTTTGSTVQFVQEWHMVLQYLHVITQFCGASGGHKPDICAPDKEQRIYFDGSGHFQFPDTYQGMVQEMLNGKHDITVGISLHLVGIVICNCNMWAGYYFLNFRTPSFRKLRITTLTAIIFSILSALLGLWGVSSFLHRSKPFRDQLEANSWIVNTKPELRALGWSAGWWLFLCV